jgi:hypothetical protein
MMERRVRSPCQGEVLNEADAEVLAAGKLSEQQLNDKNALKIGRIGFKTP